MKKTEAKLTAAAKDTPKKAAVKKTAGKKTAEKKTAAKKPAVKKPAAKKTVTKKAAAVHTTAAPVPVIVLQYGELSVDSAVIAQNVANFLQYDRNMPAGEQTNVEIYVKPEEGRAYVVVNGEEEGSILL